MEANFNKMIPTPAEQAFTLSKQAFILSALFTPNLTLVRSPRFSSGRILTAVVSFFLDKSLTR